MAYTEGIAEALERISKIKTKQGKIDALRKSHSIAMETVVDLCFNPNVKFVLPEGEPPYRPAAKAMDAQAFLFTNLRKFGIFVQNGPYRNMNPKKREMQFINFIEGCDPDDAKLVIAIKDKKMPYVGITQKLFEAAWPALASTWVEKK